MCAKGAAAVEVHPFVELQNAVILCVPVTLPISFFAFYLLSYPSAYSSISSSSSRTIICYIAIKFCMHRVYGRPERGERKKKMLEHGYWHCASGSVYPKLIVHTLNRAYERSSNDMLGVFLSQLQYLGGDAMDEDAHHRRRASNQWGYSRYMYILCCSSTNRMKRSGREKRAVDMTTYADWDTDASHTHTLSYDKRWRSGTFSFFLDIFSPTVLNRNWRGVLHPELLLLQLLKLYLLQLSWGVIRGDFWLSSSAEIGINKWCSIIIYYLYLIWWIRQIANAIANWG